MYAVEFNTIINNGTINIPMKYRDKFISDVKVILLKTESHSITSKANEAKGFGALSHLANASLWEQEDGAWERAVVEKYAVN
jgi:hypothetical protein